MKNFSAIILFLFLAFLISSCSQDAGRPKLAKVGLLAPNFTLSDTKGKTWKLSDLKGQVVFINFWATWCSPCRDEMPSMQALYSSMPADKFKLLSILSNDEPAFADITAKKLGATFPILIDPDNKTGLAYGLTGVPETFIVDKHGVLREKFIGPANWDAPDAREMIMKYLSQK